MPWPTEASIDFVTTGDNVVVSAVSGQIIRVFRLFLVVSAATNLRFKDGAGTNLTGVMSMLANGSIVLDEVPSYTSREADQPWFTTSPGNAFIINQSGTAQVSGRLYYTQGVS